jgi:hypothetical protein
VGDLRKQAEDLIFWEKLPDEEADAAREKTGLEEGDFGEDDDEDLLT